MAYEGLLLALVGTCLAVPSAKADVIYQYTGNAFTDCSFGPCPANFTSDYVVASISFAAPLTPNLPLTDLTSSLTAWSIGDAFGNFLYSSSSTPTYLTGFPTMGILPLAVSTDSLGNILDYLMGAFPAEVLGIVGTSEGGLFGPPSTSPDPRYTTIGSFVEINWGTPGEWDALSQTAGEWTQASAVPEPSSMLLALTGMGGAILTIAVRRKQRALGGRSSD